jgi:hypothetical protein
MNRPQQSRVRLLGLVAWGVLSLLVLVGRADAGNTGKFGEKRAQKLYAFSEDGDKWYEIGSAGSFTFSKTFFIFDPVDPMALGPNSTVEITLGDWYFYAPLNDADKGYVTGQTSVKFTLIHQYWVWNPKTDQGTLKSVKAGTVSLKFTSKGTVVSISCKTGYDPKKDLELEDSPIAANYIEVNGSIDTTMYVAIQIDPAGAVDAPAFAGWATSHLFDIIGEGSVKNVTKGEDHWSLGSVKVKGTLAEE